MPELRKDPVIGRWVIIATERGKRPTDFPTRTDRVDSRICPFCPGNESATPPEILTLREHGTYPNTPGWRVRTISNKFPALKIEGDLQREGVGIFDKMNGIGAHEVIIETPNHEQELESMSISQVAEVLWMYRERVLDLEKDSRFRYVMVFKNKGVAAGASLSHSHSQLIATPVVPKRVAEELSGAHKYFEYKERCIFCDIVRQELNDKIRVISENDSFVAIEPFAPRFPFETWLLPKQHESRFVKIGDDRIESLAAVLKDCLWRISTVLNNPPYNYMIHAAPHTSEHGLQYHWHIELIPKLTRVAGFEWGTGFYINPTPPEDAAQYLREAQVTSPAPQPVNPPH
jgi:UDPglucose--hexose-1-phosphate uridylyltransferase